MDFRYQPARLGRALVIGAIVAAGAAPAGCGKKGPPLAPLVSLPAGVSDLTARRIGETVYVQFTVPVSNADGMGPADVRAVEVYAYTAFEPENSADLKRLTLVATIPVKPPPKPVEASDEGAPARVEQPPEEAGVDQGAKVTIAEAVTDDVRVLLPPDPKARKPKVPPVPTPEFARAFPESQLTRFYVAVGVNRKGKRGARSQSQPAPLTAAAPAAPPPVTGALQVPAAVSSAPLGDAPPAPRAPEYEVTETAVVLSWPRPQGLRKPYLDAEAAADFEALVFGWFVTLPAPPRIASTPKGLPPRPAVGYNVYRLPDPGEPGAPALPPVPGLVDMPAPIGPNPVVDLTFPDPDTQWGVRRCYGIRTVEVDGSGVVESGLSPVTCLTPEDTFPPAAPASLTAVASQAAISLIWDRVEAPDLAGYIVLRGAAPDGPLEPLFETPIRETTYRDAAALPGQRYVYEVIAVDNATIPNRSAPSNRVVEVAR